MLQRLKRKILNVSKKKGRTHLFISVAFLVISISTLTVLAQTSAKSEPTSPITKTAKGSTVLLASADQEVSEKLRKDGIKLTQSEKNQGENEDPKNKTSDETTKKDDKEVVAEESAVKQTQQENNNSPNKVIGKDSKVNQNNYFTTSIIDKEVVSTEKYYFKIYQKAHDFKVKKEEVSVNKQALVTFKGEVKLKTGDNLIQVVVTYVDQEGAIFTATKEYHVLYEEKLLIKTNLTDFTKVEKSELNYQASASIGNKQVDLTILLNGKKIETTKKNEHRLTLKEGKNKIELLAKLTGQELKKSYDVTYTKPKKEQTEESSTEDSSTTESSTESGEEENENDPKAPKIEVDFADGITLKGLAFDFDVTVTDYLGNDIGPGNRDSGFIVELAGNQLSYDWSNPRQTHFTANLKPGENKIKIRATDSEGRVTIFEPHVYGTEREAGEIVGQITISVEASTIGLGNIINPVQVEIKEGQKTSHVITELLANEGYGYDYKGSLESSFYLSQIKAPGRTMWPGGTPRIIPEIEQLLLEQEIDYDLELEAQKELSLGEFDFTPLSGWMYSVNGVYQNVGMTDKVLRDGDTVRLRYTLMLGSDIGGGENFGDW